MTDLREAEIKKWPEVRLNKKPRKLQWPWILDYVDGHVTIHFRNLHADGW